MHMCWLCFVTFCKNSSLHEKKDHVFSFVTFTNVSSERKMRLFKMCNICMDMFFVFLVALKHSHYSSGRNWTYSRCVFKQKICHLSRCISNRTSLSFSNLTNTYTHTQTCRGCHGDVHPLLLGLPWHQCLLGVECFVSLQPLCLLQQFKQTEHFCFMPVECSAGYLPTLKKDDNDRHSRRAGCGWDKLRK